MSLSKCADPILTDECAEPDACAVCSVCKNVYRSHNALRKHAKQMHPEQADELAPNKRDVKSYKFKCDHCKYHCNDIYKFRSHMRKVHDITNDATRTEKVKKCPMCCYKSTKDEMLVHFETVHDITLENIELNFNNFDEFVRWKDKMEREDKCKFIVKRGVYASKFNTKHYFMCHRSGFYVSEGKGQRHQKTQGSNKIDGYCPAEINVTVNETGVCSIKFCKTHVGHDITNDATRTENVKKCPMCCYKSTKDEMLVHFETVHDITLENIELNFNNFDEFARWKDKMEREDKCKFIAKCGVYASKFNTKHYFMCHRSGFYISEGKGLRHLKMQGSNKIDGYCPAEINVTVNETGVCSIKFCKTHVGHTNDLRYLSLTDSERQSIATKIASKMPFEDILNEIRDSVTDSNLERIHLLTKKDLYNIESCFNNGSTADLCMYETGRDTCEETNILITELSKKNQETSNLCLTEKKEELKRDFHEILENVTSLEDLKLVEKAVKSLKPILTANSNSTVMNLPKKSAPHKHIQPQKQLFSTRKRKRKTENQINKPNQEEM